MSLVKNLSKIIMILLPRVMHMPEHCNSATAPVKQYVTCTPAFEGLEHSSKFLVLTSSQKRLQNRLQNRQLCYILPQQKPAEVLQGSVWCRSAALCLSHPSIPRLRNEVTTNNVSFMVEVLESAGSWVAISHCISEKIPTTRTHTAVKTSGGFLFFGTAGILGFFL